MRTSKIPRFLFFVLCVFGISSTSFSQEETVESIGGTRVTSGPTMVERADGSGFDEVKIETAYFVVRGTEKEKVKMLRDIDRTANAAKEFLDKAMRDHPGISKYVVLLNPDPEDKKSRKKIHKDYSNSDVPGKMAKYVGAVTETSQSFNYQNIENAPGNIKKSLAISEGLLPGATVLSMDVSAESRQKLTDSKDLEKNGVKEWSMAVFRGTLNGVGVFTGAMYIATPTNISISMGALSGMMSKLLQLKHIPFTRWVSGKGIVKPSRFHEASLQEGMFKDALLTVGYLGLIYALQGALEASLPTASSGMLNMEYAHNIIEAIKRRLIVPIDSFPYYDLLKVAALGGISEGFWNTNISHLTTQLSEKHPEKKAKIDSKSRWAGIALSFVGTMSTVLGGMGVEAGVVTLIGLSASGLVVDLIYVGNVKKLYNSMLGKTRWLKSSFRSSRRCEAAILGFL